ncbi:MAG: hypothetical protein M3281_07415, partial [Chloroflexota bacterium]|nr:hypothetical protein [Chloroflexota bacterium]
SNASVVWSPTAYELAYIRLKPGTDAGALVVQSATGRPLRTLVAGGVTQLAWSPNGDRLAYTRTTDTSGDGKLHPELDRSEVWIVDRQGGRSHRLAQGFDPAWSPDSRQVLLATSGRLAQGYRERNELRLYGVDGKLVRTVARVSDVPSDLQQYGTPFLSATRLLRHGAIGPDGRTVAFSALGGVGILGTVGLSGGKVQVQDTLVESGFGRVVWEHRGSRIAYEVPLPSGTDQVVVLDIQTGDRSAYGSQRERTGYTEPAWSPTGASLALVRKQASGRRSLVRVDLARKRVATLVSGPVSSPSWNPASGAGGGGR